MNTTEAKDSEATRSVASEPSEAPVRSSDGLAARPSLEELETTWAELWKHLGEPTYSPSAIEIAKHCFMVGVDWGIKRAANA